ncbi:MAG: hypothetical protein ACR2KT_09690 [Methylocella sp.]
MSRSWTSTVNSVIESRRRGETRNKSLALGLAACQGGFVVAFFTAAGLVHQSMEARDKRLSRNSRRSRQSAHRHIESSIRGMDDYQTPDQRAAALPIWTQQNNWHRPHRSPKSNPPISRLGLFEDKLLRLHI